MGHKRQTKILQENKQVEKLTIIYTPIYIGHGKRRLFAVVRKKKMNENDFDYTVEDMGNYKVIKFNNNKYLKYHQEILTDELLAKMGIQEENRIQREKNAKIKGKTRLKSVRKKLRYTKLNKSPFVERHIKNLNNILNNSGS